MRKVVQELNMKRATMENEEDEENEGEETNNQTEESNVNRICWDEFVFRLNSE